MKKSYKDAPLVENAYITVVGKIDDIIEFAKAATKPSNKRKPESKRRQRNEKTNQTKRD